MGEPPDAVVFDINDVDAAAVGAYENGRVVLGKAKDDVFAEG